MVLGKWSRWAGGAGGEFRGGGVGGEFRGDGVKT